MIFEFRANLKNKYGNLMFWVRGILLVCGNKWEEKKEHRESTKNSFQG